MRFRISNDFLDLVNDEYLQELSGILKNEKETTKIQSCLSGMPDRSRIEKSRVSLQTMGKRTDGTLRDHRGGWVPL